MIKIIKDFILYFLGGMISWLVFAYTVNSIADMYFMGFRPFLSALKEEFKENCLYIKKQTYRAKKVLKFCEKKNFELFLGLSLCKSPVQKKKTSKLN